MKKIAAVVLGFMLLNICIYDGVFYESGEGNRDLTLSDYFGRIKDTLSGNTEENKKAAESDDENENNPQVNLTLFGYSYGGGMEDEGHGIRIVYDEEEKVYILSWYSCSGDERTEDSMELSEDTVRKIEKLIAENNVRYEINRKEKSSEEVCDKATSSYYFYSNDTCYNYDEYDIIDKKANDALYDIRELLYEEVKKRTEQSP